MGDLHAQKNLNSYTRILEMSHATKMIGEGCVMGRSTRQKLFSKKLAFKTVRKPYVNFLFRKMSFIF